MEDYTDILNEPLSQDPAQLQDIIKKAREAETKAKTQIYTIRGKKGLAQLASSFKHLDNSEENINIEEDLEKSPHIIEMRRQIALLREMEAAQRQEIERLKMEKAEREKRQGLSNPSIVSQPSFTSAVVEERNIEVEQAQPKQATVRPPNIVSQPPNVVAQPPNVVSQPPKIVSQPPQSSFVDSPAPSPAREPSAPSVQEHAPQPSTLGSSSNLGSSSGLGSSRAIGSSISKDRKGNTVLGAPQSYVTKVLNASWDGGPAKSKKNNKVYTIQVTYEMVTWKIIRGDDALAELSKKLAKVKAEGVPLPPLVKKVCKREQQAELATSVEQYLNQLALPVIFAPKRDKSKAAFLKFFAPFLSRDEGQGSFPGTNTDYEGWFVWRLQQQ